MNVYASGIVSIDNRACKYAITLPEGWDTIPQSFLKEKLKQFNVDMGIYPVAQGDYTKGYYALICFMPAVKTLNAFNFKQIVADFTKAGKQGEIKTDSMQIRFNKMNTKVEEGDYYIFNYYSIRKDTVALESCQMLQPTKFGYISVMSYIKNNEVAVSMDELSAQLSKIVTVHPDYKYVEYRKEGLTFIHVLISLAIGLIVYVFIMWISKKKKQR
ncbi:MAG: hypothetical protein LBG15_11340 [Dysgonamonadaceae bacterium]|jgi:hypothetical protein|nr:hypothetical protein [Dysgonamonadaceae bacterium]